MTATIRYTDDRVDLKFPATTPEELAVAVQAIRVIATQSKPTPAPAPRKPITRARWTQDEDEFLRAYVDTYGACSREHRQLVQELAATLGRTYSAVVNRWTRLYNEEN